MLLFASDGATEAQFCDTPHAMILSDTAKYYQCQDCLEPSFCVHCTTSALLANGNKTMDINIMIILQYLSVFSVF